MPFKDHPTQIQSRSFFENETKTVARSLLGHTLISSVDNEFTSGIIVETEAYLPENDSACHASKHRTNRTEVMFGRAGVAYVYPIHARFCFNVVTEVAERGCAVLIRALQPTKGLDIMKHRRSIDIERRLTTGPACLCQALGIDRSLNGMDLTSSLCPIQIWSPPTDQILPIKTSVRIGVTSAKNRKLRYYVPSNKFVSGPLKLRT